MSERRLTAEGLELGVRIMQLEADLRACQAHTEYLEQRIERLRAVARAAKELPRQVFEWLWLEERWEFGLAVEALQPGDVEESS